jgi:hypothetical protein
MYEVLLAIEASPSAFVLLDAIVLIGFQYFQREAFSRFLR